MKRVSIVILMVLLLPVAGLLAQSRAEKPNDFTLELGGKCLLYSLAYQRMIGETAGLEIGASYIGGGSGGESAGVFFLSGGLRLYLTKKGAAPCLSAGVVYVSAGTDAGPFGEDSSSGVYFYAGPGFEYRMSGGFLFRGSVNLLFKGSFFFVWPGLTFGIAF
jgi:hypothetical protein